MDKKRAAVFAAGGLGDGLLMAIVAYNFRQAGYQVTLFHPLADQLRPLFPLYLLTPSPPFKSLEETLEPFSEIVVQNNYLDDAHALIELSKKKRWEKMIFFHTASRTLSSNRPITANRLEPLACQLATACQKLLGLQAPLRENGLKLPEECHYRRHWNRIAIHPTGSHLAKCWPEKKFLRLSERLEELGFNTVFCLHPDERPLWLKKGVDPKRAPFFPDLKRLGAFLYESSLLIGNDSGIGHFASNLGLLTITLARSLTKGNFWRPGWQKGQLIAPYTIIPNLKGFRVRDTYWKKWISVQRVISTFLKVTRNPFFNP